MLERIDSRTLAEYMALDRIDPQGSFRGDVQAAVVASTVANCHRGKGSRAFGIKDFLPFTQDEKQTSSDIETQLMQLVQLTKGSD